MKKTTNSPADKMALLYSAVELLWKDGYIVTQVKIKNPIAGTLLIIQVKTTEGPKIAFIGGLDMLETAKKLHEGVRTGSIKWRLDDYELKRLGALQ